VAGDGQSPPPYPEVAWVSRSSYCNPYFGLRFSLPRELKTEAVALPVSGGSGMSSEADSIERHMLLALHVRRLDRDADLFISATSVAGPLTSQDATEDAARIAARQHLQQARASGLGTSGPNALSVHQHAIYRLHVLSLTGENPPALRSAAISAPAADLGNESSYFLSIQGYVLHVAIFSHDDSLAQAIGSSIEHLELPGPGLLACQSPDDHGGDLKPNADELPHLYYGPALPTALVESTLRAQPGNAVPAGSFSGGAFTDGALGFRLELPPDWQPIPVEDAYQVTELMRDPVTDPDVADRRRALFRACSRVVFAAADLRDDLVSPAPFASAPEASVHPGLAVVAIPQGCVPDLVMPHSPEDRAGYEEFVTLLVRSLGVLQLTRGYVRLASGDHQAPAPAGLGFPLDIVHLDGALPYRLPGELLARRLSLRVSAIASGQWFIFVYSVTANPAQERELDSRISLLPAPGAGAGSLAASPAAAASEK
jgi:hypothetical protein